MACLDPTNKSRLITAWRELLGRSWHCSGHPQPGCLVILAEAQDLAGC